MRILVCDDDRGVLAAYRSAFTSIIQSQAHSDLSALETSLFPGGGDDATPTSTEFNFEITYVEQGDAAVATVKKSLAAGAPFQAIFLDMRMPPGMDGKATAQQIRNLDQDAYLIMVTGYSDNSPLEVAKVAGPLDKLFYVAKPFEIEEVMHLARSLCHRWQSEAELKAARVKLEDHVRLLQDANTQLQASEARIRHAAFHDSLTGAPNRAAFLRELTERVQARSKNYAVAMLDLDRFKAVNDNFGHAAGDELVRSIWESLKENLPSGALAARIGGDEFGIIVPDADEKCVRDICEDIIALCQEERSIFGHAVKVGASLGVAFALEHERDKTDIARRADLALYAAKRAGRGQVQFFDPTLDESARFRLKIENGLRKALEADELSLAFQPIVSQENLGVVGFEALIRWDSPEFGSLSPSLFIPIAEESILIHQLGDWVIPRALEACKAWPGQYVSINFSPRQFLRPQLKQKLLDAVARAGLPPGRIQIELTETALFENVDDAAVVLNDLQAAGFRVALDDFGTGYSSLFNLRNFNINCIKIDKSFVGALGKETNATAIVSAMTQLARSMGLSVVAEGVEDQFQHHALQLAGCSHMQGYWFGYPVDAASAEAITAQVPAHTEQTAAAS
ncbi:MAG: EAL domain-containing protein [Vitreimonas sp.]